MHHASIPLVESVPSAQAKAGTEARVADAHAMRLALTKSGACGAITLSSTYCHASEDLSSLWQRYQAVSNSAPGLFSNNKLAHSAGSDVMSNVSSQFTFWALVTVY